MLLTCQRRRQSNQREQDCGMKTNGKRKHISQEPKMPGSPFGQREKIKQIQELYNV